MISATNTQLCHCSRTAARDNTEMHECGHEVKELVHLARQCTPRPVTIGGSKCCHCPPRVLFKVALHPCSSCHECWVLMACCRSPYTETCPQLTKTTLHWRSHSLPSSSWQNPTASGDNKDQPSCLTEGNLRGTYCICSEVRSFKLQPMGQLGPIMHSIPFPMPKRSCKRADRADVY